MNQCLHWFKTDRFLFEVNITIESVSYRIKLSPRSVYRNIRGKRPCSSSCIACCSRRIICNNASVVDKPGVAVDGVVRNTSNNIGTDFVVFFIKKNLRKHVQEQVFKGNRRVFLKEQVSFEYFNIEQLLIIKKIHFSFQRKLALSLEEKIFSSCDCFLFKFGRLSS
jgi:hypothetical protein